MMTFILIFVGCGNSRDAFIDGQDHPRKADDAPIEVFLTTKPERPYTEIALVRFPAYKKGDKTIRTLKDKAREKGGDGVIVIGKGFRIETGFFGDVNGSDVVEAVVIIWKK